MFLDRMIFLDAEVTSVMSYSVNFFYILYNHSQGDFIGILTSYIPDTLFAQIIYKMIEENPGDVGHEMNELSIVYGDESLPRLYENSQISSDQLTGQPGGYLAISRSNSSIFISC